MESRPPSFASAGDKRGNENGAAALSLSKKTRAVVGKGYRLVQVSRGLVRPPTLLCLPTRTSACAATVDALAQGRTFPEALH